MENDKNQNKKIIFPDDSLQKITKLMEECGLKEEIEDAMKKIAKNKATIGEIIAGVVKETAMGNITDDDLVSFLQKELNLSPKIAQKLADGVKKEILALTRTEIREEELKTKEPAPVVIESESSISQRKKENHEEKLHDKDEYREPIEQ